MKNPQNKNTKNTIYLLEYDNLYSCGRRFNPLDIVINQKLGFNFKKAQEDKILGFIYNKNEILPIYLSHRGGGITHQGNGQRVIDPFIDLSIFKVKSIKLYIKFFEQWIINTLSIFKIQSTTIDGMSGVWRIHNNTPYKIGFIGIKISSNITYHEISVNISNDFKYFDLLNPCGIRNCHITSVQSLGVKITLDEFDEVLIDQFNQTIKYFLNQDNKSKERDLMVVGTF